MSPEFDIAEFRLEFPEFTDVTKYPDTVILFWAHFGDRIMNIQRWGDFREDGLKLFVAHNITLWRQGYAIAAVGGIAGLGVGLASSESAGPLSYSMDYGSFLTAGAGEYNLTRYGLMYWRLVNIVGMGGTVV